jgi:hypothetical protein
LRQDNVGDRAALPLVTPGSRDRVSPGRGVCGVSSKKLTEPVEVECVVCRQAPDPGKPTDIDSKPRR